MASDYLNSYRPTLGWRMRGADRAHARSESYPELCSPAFYRELEKFADNVELDFELLSSEEHEITSWIRRGHSLNMVGVGGGAFTQAHLDFWENRYGVEPGVTRRLGTRGRVAEQRQGPRKLKWHDQQMQRARDQAAMAAELEHERLAWAKAQEDLKAEREKNLARMKKADLEWEREERRRQEREEAVYWHGKPKAYRNLYVPEWKRRETRLAEGEVRLLVQGQHQRSSFSPRPA